MTKLYISSSFATGQVNVDDGLILFAPPVWRRFVGQPLENLLSWLHAKSPSVVVEPLI
jgi:hypothetical protein